MKNLFDYEKTQSATADLPFGAFKDESAPGQQNGTDIVAAHIQDIAYPLYQVLQLAGVTPNGELEDGNNKTQFIQALTNIGICRHSDKGVYNKSVFVWTILGNDFVLYRSIKEENSAELNDTSSWQKILEIGSDNVLKFAVDTNIELEHSVESYLTNCILSAPNEVATSSGGTVTVKSGLKALFSNGRNADKTLKNMELTLTNDVSFSLVGSGSETRIGFLCYQNTFKIIAPLERNYFKQAAEPADNGLLQVWYNPDTNIFKWRSESSAWTALPMVEVCKASGTSTIVTSLEVNQPVELVKRSDIPDIWCNAVPTTTSSASSAQPAVVIQNYVSGTSWYRVWSDGWIEQGGRVQLTSQNTTGTVVSFLKAFQNTNYSVTAMVERYTSTAVSYTDDSTVLIQGLATNNMTLMLWDANNNTYQTYVRWRACGY